MKGIRLTPDEAWLVKLLLLNADLSVEDDIEEAAGAVGYTTDEALAVLGKFDIHKRHGSLDGSIFPREPDDEDDEDTTT